MHFEGIAGHTGWMTCGSGQCTIQGVVSSGPVAFDMYFVYNQTVASGTPKTGGGPALASWTYWALDLSRSTLKCRDLASPACKTLAVRPMGPPGQLGMGANDKTLTFGFSAWFEYADIGSGAGTGTWFQGDVNIDLAVNVCTCANCNDLSGVRKSKMQIETTRGDTTCGIASAKPVATVFTTSSATTWNQLVWTSSDARFGAQIYSNDGKFAMASAGLNGAAVYSGPRRRFDLDAYVLVDSDFTSSFPEPQWAMRCAFFVNGVKVARGETNSETDDFESGNVSMKALDVELVFGATVDIRCRSAGATSSVTLTVIHCALSI